MVADEVPLVEMPEVVVPGRLEDPEEVALIAAPGAVGPFADIASTSVGCLGVGPSGGASQGGN